MDDGLSPEGDATGDEHAMRTPEIRTYRSTVELREAKRDGSVGTLFGYAAKFNKLSRNLGGFVETIAPEAFNKSIADGVRIMCRYNHEVLIATTDAGTLRVWVDEVGLPYEVDLPDTSAGRDLAVMTKRQDVRHSSFAFLTPPNGDEWSLTDSDFPLRTLRSVQLVDVAPVDDPAYLDTSSGLRSLAEARGLDFARVQAAAAANDLRALIKAGIEPSDPLPSEVVTDETPSVPVRSLDVMRNRLELLRIR